jgi:type I restriction enzyme R subunit
LEAVQGLFDLSTIDFERLAELFARGQKRTATEILRGQAEERARDLANRNPTRADLLERLNNLIDRYNAGSRDVERLFEELTAFVQAMNEEEQRHLKEGLTEEELAIFDILTRPEPKLTKAEELEVKKIARQLLTKLKREKLILDWRSRETAKADVRETIKAGIRSASGRLRAQAMGREGRKDVSVCVRTFRDGQRLLGGQKGR